MNKPVHIFFCLLPFMWLPTAWGSDATSTFEECISEPVFEGQVCTVQANPNARAGVILIHGLDGSVEDWKKTIPVLSENFHVVAFDLPGFGKSDKGSQEYTPTRYARLAQFLANRYFPDKPFNIVGHSMGGAIALRFAAQQPLRFQRLVLIDAAGILHPMVITKFQAGSMVANASGVGLTRGPVERLSGKLLEKADQLPISPFDIFNSMLGRERILQGGPSKIAAMGLAEEDFTYAISTVTAPTLVMWGDNDTVAPLRTGRVLAARMPRARLEIISGSGHEPMKDQPARMNALINEHLLASEVSLARSFGHATPRTTLNSTRDGSCTGESGMVFEGDYNVIDLRDCSNITIRNARVGSLNVLNSRVNLTDTDIAGKDVGLHADNSEIAITNGDISGTIAIETTLSRLDLAGVHLNGARDAVKGVNSKLTFSVSRISSPHGSGNLHTFKNLVDETL